MEVNFEPGEKYGLGFPIAPFPSSTPPTYMTISYGHIIAFSYISM